MMVWARGCVRADCGDVDYLPSSVLIGTSLSVNLLWSSYVKVKLI